MNNEELIITAAAISWGSALAAGVYNVIGSTIYDAKQSMLQKRINKHPNSRYLRKRPFITVVILSNNNASTLNESIEAVLKGSYKKIELIVADNASSDDSIRKARHLSKQYGSNRIKVMYVRSPDIKRLLQRSIAAAKGDYIGFLNADCRLNANSLKDSINALQTQQTNYWALDFNPVSEPRMSSFAARLSYLLLDLPRVKIAVIKRQAKIQPGLLYRSDSINLRKNPARSVSFVFRLVNALLKYLFSILKLSWLVLVGYFAYLAIFHDYAQPLAIFLLAAVFYALLMIITSANNLGDKLSTLLTLPGGLAYIYISFAIRVFRLASSASAQFFSFIF